MQRMTDVTATVHAGEPAWTVGIDLGRRAAHEAVLRAPDGTDRRLRFTHSRDGIDGFLEELAGLEGRVLVIIEPTATRWQALAEELSGKGVEVRQVHAATVAKLRGARDITGAKSDRVDARTLAGAIDYSHLVRPDTPAVACAHALCLERLRLRRERRRLRGAVKTCLDTIWPEFLQTFRGGERGVTARAVIAVTGGDPARATRLGAEELERRVRAAAPGRHIGHNKIKQLIEKTSRPVGYRAARPAYAARLQRLMRRRALVEGQLEALEEELLHLYPRLPGAQRLDSLPGLENSTGRFFSPPRRHPQAALGPRARQARRLRTNRKGLRAKHPETQDLRALPLPAARRCLSRRQTHHQSVPCLPGALPRTAPKAHRQTSRDRVREPAAARDLAHGQQRRQLQPREGRPCPEPLAHTQPRLSSHDTPERKPASAISSPRARARNKGPCARQRPHKAPGHQGRTRT